MLAAVVAATSAVGAPAGEATGELSASCDITLTTNGGPAGKLAVRGAYRLLGGIPATSPRPRR
ncbi:hypothetical protein AB0M48_34300 [Lentzea sp. NPDC051208]|uniref:hypothetical protein n=1 Tax=Lentzea sp. NPDC051208 TaxID=3154642 RepID=UPI00341A99FA